MLKIGNTDVLGWEHAIRGMRNPMNSWEKIDSSWRYVAPAQREGHILVSYFDDSEFWIGPNDADLMKRLRNAGTDHRKFMRMIVVYLDITAPLYWWKEFDTYKVGTVANSSSTMHKIAAKEFTLEDFSHEHLNQTAKLTLQKVIKELNTYRDGYIHGVEETDDLTGEHISIDPHDKNIWWQMIQLLPSSYNQRRTVMLNYEVLANIYKSRRNHKLDEWHTFCDWIEGLPYSELVTGPNLKDIPISYEIMEEAKRRVHEELDAQLDYFCKLHEG